MRFCTMINVPNNGTVPLAVSVLSSPQLSMRNLTSPSENVGCFFRKRAMTSPAVDVPCEREHYNACCCATLGLYLQNHSDAFGGRQQRTNGQRVDFGHGGALVLLISKRVGGGRVGTGRIGQIGQRAGVAAGGSANGLKRRVHVARRSAIHVNRMGCIGVSDVVVVKWIDWIDWIAC